MSNTIVDAITLNSFFYFFSAVPQVLSGILALFGFFLVFKIQSLKDELLISADVVLQFFREEYNKKDSLIRSPKMLNIISDMKKGIQDKSIRELFFVINNCDKHAKSICDENFLTMDFLNSYGFYQKLKKSTQRFALLTITIIFECLTILPFSKCILDKPQLLIVLFYCTVILIGICLIGLIIILNFALSEKSILEEIGVISKIKP